MKGRGGRPELWPLEAMIEPVCDAIRQGASEWAAACAAGISREVWRKWWRTAHRKGAFAGEEELVQQCRWFFDSLDEAAATAMSTAEKIVFIGSPDKTLKRPSHVRRGPRGWGESWNEAQRVELSGPKGGPLQSETKSVAAVFDMTKLSPDEAMALRGLMLKAQAKPADDLLSLDAEPIAGELPAHEDEEEAE